MPSSCLFEPLSLAVPTSTLEVDGQRLTPLELQGAVASVAALLDAHGIHRGERVAVAAQPALETAVAMVAVVQSGRVLVPIDAKLGITELGHILRDASPRICLAADASALQDRLGSLPIVAMPNHATAPAPTPRHVDDAPALILYTSGTTGLPKGAVISARNVAANLDALADAWGWSAEDTIVHGLPLFHVHGLVLGLFGPLRRGGHLRWVSRFTPAALGEALALGPRTVLFAVPTMYHRLADAPEAVAGLRAARLLVSGSAPLPRRDADAIARVAGKPVIERYGLTETLINCAARLDTPDDDGRVGPSLPGVELKLVDDERRTLEALDDTTIGEVAVRGPNVFLGYLGLPEATAAVKDTDGWFYTGDLACRRADGSIRVVGRRSVDLIKCGGYKVGAGEVEGALLEHPSVREAAVVGVADADLGERIEAWVVAPGFSDGAALERHVASLLSAHKRPRAVHFVEQLPRNAMGKVLKKVLKASR